MDEEVRCPMCSKPNPAEAEVCEFCGARLKPLVAGEGGQPPEEAGEGREDWLEAFRAEAVGAGEEEENDEEAFEDWLGRLEEVSASEEPEGEAEEEVPDWLARLRAEEAAAAEEAPEGEPEEAEEEGGPDWLGRLRPAEGYEEGPPEEPPPAWLSEAEGAGEEPAGPEAEAPEEVEEPAEPEGAVPDWLAELQAEGQAEAPEAAPEGEPEEAELPDWLSEPVAEEAPAGEEEELPDWLAELREEGGAAPEEVAPEEAPPSEWAEPAEAEAPGVAEEAGPELEPLPAEEIPGWLAQEAEPEPEAEVEGEGEGEEGEVPEWLARIREQEAAERAAAQPAEEPAPAEPEPEEEAAAPEAERPAWLEEVEPEAGEEALPHVPAFVMGEEAPPLEAADFDLSAVELPDWLSEVEAAEAEGAAGAPARGEEAPDLAPATLPAWLEAMRPVETFRPVVDLEPEEELVVETVGPLAGLRGVLIAEPVVAKPRRSTIGGARLEVTERQFAQAEILRRLVETEEREGVAAVPRARRLPLLWWAVSLLLTLAVAASLLLGTPTFGPPARVPRDLGSLIQLVDNLPADRPVLLVFDYEPGFSGELDAVAGALVEHLMARDLRLVTLSTRPTGPPLAERLLGSVGAGHGAENGKTYLHLGYLAGGPTAVQLFAAAPRRAVLEGFLRPTDLAGASVWDSPLLSSVQRLSDFGMVAVITTGTEAARVWAEQAHPWLGDTPLVMVLTTGAEPMIRPYFESLDPQVNGILSGLPSALAYEQVNGRPAAAQARWNGYGVGMLVAVGLLAVGAAYGLVRWALARWRA